MIVKLFNNIILWLLRVLLQTKQETLEFVLDKQDRYLKKMAILLPLTFWGTILATVSPLFIKWQIDALTEKWMGLNINNWWSYQIGDTWAVFSLIAAGYFILQLFNKILNWFKEKFLRVLNFESKNYLEDKFTNHLTRFDSSFLGAENNLRLIRNLQWQFNSLQDKFIELIQGLIKIPVSIISFIFILPLIHPLLMGFVAITSIISIILDGIKSNMWRQYELLENRQNDLRWNLQWRIINYFNSFLTNGWLENIYNLYKNRRLEWQLTNIKQNNRNQNFQFFIDLINELVSFGTNLLAGFLVITGKISVGTFTVYFYYVNQIKSLVYDIGNLFKNIIELRFSLFRIEFLLQINPKIDYSNIKEFVPNDIQTLTIKNLSFGYPKFYEQEKNYLLEMQKRVGMYEDKPKTFLAKQIKKHLPKWMQREITKEFEDLNKIFELADENKTILNNFNLEFKKGVLYGIVGYNGAGKTTLTKLLKRVLDPSSGEILVDGYPLKQIDPIKWRHNFSSLEQSSYLIDSLSIRDNLLLNANKKIDDEEIWRILKILELDSVVTSLDMILGEGVSLSGGQNQLLELTRVLIDPKPIIVLDEGTNQLDAIKESRVLNLIKEKTKNSIVIFITHRMTTCLKCDSVVVIDKGQIQVKGDPKQLLKAKKENLFQEFWNVQVGKDID